MATFTNTINGNCNDGATFGNASPGTAGVDYPNPAGGDTLNCAAQKTVTIPLGYSLICTLTAAAGVIGTKTKLVINGSLKLQADFVPPTYFQVDGGPGGIWDLAGFKWNPTGNRNWLNWQGTDGNPFVLKSTVGGGKWSYTTSNFLDINWNYVSFTGLSDSTFGNGTDYSAGQHIRINHLQVDNTCGDLSISGSSHNVASDWTVDNSDFRNAAGTNKFLLNGNISANPTTGVRRIRHCTFKSPAGTLGIVSTQYDGFTLDGQVVFENVVWRNKKSGSAANTGTQIFQTNDNANGNFIETSCQGDQQITNSYFYIGGTNRNAHVLNNSATAPGLVATGNVFEATATSEDANMVTVNYGNQASPPTITVTGNLLIKAGNLLVYHPANGLKTNHTALTFEHNTAHGSNSQGTENDYLLFATEVSDYASGTVNVRDNICVDSNRTGGTQYGVRLQYADADQLASCDYNCQMTDANYTNVNLTGGYGTHDVNQDPQFVDSTACLATFDTAMGGPGTAANVVAMLLRINGYGGAADSRYNVDDIRTWVQNRFKIQNAALRTAAHDGTQIGAFAYQAPAAPTSGSSAASTFLVLAASLLLALGLASPLAGQVPTPDTTPTATATLARGNPAIAWVGQPTLLNLVLAYANQPKDGYLVLGPPNVPGWEVSLEQSLHVLPGKTVTDAVLLLRATYRGQAPTPTRTVSVDLLVGGAKISTAAFTLAVRALSDPIPPAASAEFKAAVKTWEGNFRSRAPKYYNATEAARVGSCEGGGWYYDGGRVCFSMGDYLQDAEILALAPQALSYYRDKYVLPANGVIGGWRVFARGLRWDWERNKTEASKQAAILLARNAPYNCRVGTTPTSAVVSTTRIREVSYAILAATDAILLGEDPAQYRLKEWVNILLAHVQAMAIARTETYVQPFMLALACEAMATYDRYFPGDPRIGSHLQAVADYLAEVAWVEAAATPSKSRSWWYESYPLVGDNMPLTPIPSPWVRPTDGSPDLNLLILPVLAEVHRRTGQRSYLDLADRAFISGVQNAWIDQGKQLSQNYRWSSEYVAYRLGR